MAEETSLETSNYELKSQFAGSARDWLEIIKDVVAIANSGGGRIVFGVDDSGSPTGLGNIKIDPAVLTDKIGSYCGVQFSKFLIKTSTQSGAPITTLYIDQSPTLLVFIKPGQFELEGSSKGKQQTVFGKGTVFFRHGAKSEHASPSDIRAWEDKIGARAIEDIKENLRQVVELPAGQRAKVIPYNEATDSGDKICLTNDPNATIAKLIDPFVTHPYRLIDLIRQFNSRMNGKAKISSYDIQCVRKVHGIDDRSDFFYKPSLKNTSPVYSDLFLHWLIDQYTSEPHFFELSREQFASGRKAILVEKPSFSTHTLN